VRWLFVLALVAGCSSNDGPMGTSQGTGGAVCMFAAVPGTSNLKTTQLDTDAINDTIFGNAQNGVARFTWLHSGSIDGGCLSNDQMIVTLSTPPVAGMSYPCSGDAQTVTWLEGDCTSTRAWQCASGNIKINDVSATTVDLQFDGMTFSPGGFTTNLASGDVAANGSCTAIKTAF
jgi:hypothetical protein